MIKTLIASVLALSTAAAFAVSPTTLHGVKMPGHSDGLIRLSSEEVTSSTDTDDLPEGGSNVYWTAGRFNAAFSSKSTSDLIEGSNLYYTSARFDSALSGKSTSDLSEGSRLYFTDARARAAISGTSPVSYNNTTGAISMAAASASVNGYLSSGDWSTFNAKLSALTYTPSAPSCGLNANFTPSSTYAVSVCYSISIGCTINLSSSSCSGSVELRSDTNATPTTARAQASFSKSGSLVLGLSMTDTVIIPLCYVIPPGHNVRLVSSGTATMSITTQSEVQITPI